MRTYRALLGADLNAYARIEVEANTDAEAIEQLTTQAAQAVFQPELSTLGEFRIVCLEHAPKSGPHTRLVVEDLAITPSDPDEEGPA